MTAQEEEAPPGGGAVFQDPSGNEPDSPQNTSQTLQRDRYSNALRDFIWKFLGLSASERLVLVAMAEFADWRTGEDIRPGTRRIMRMTNLSRSTVQRSRKRLLRVGAIEQVRPSGPKDPATYRLLMPSSEMTPGSTVIPPRVAPNDLGRSESHTTPGSTVTPNPSLPSIDPSPPPSEPAEVVKPPTIEEKALAVTLMYQRNGRDIKSVPSYAKKLQLKWGPPLEAEYARTPEGIEFQAALDRASLERQAAKEKAAIDGCETCDDRGRVNDFPCEHDPDHPDPWPLREVAS